MAQGRTEAPPAVLLTRSLLDCPALLQADRILVGFSGGLDSTVLLHLLATLRAQGHLSAQLIAVHVHHGLQADADAWQEHCEYQCRTLGIDCLSRRVDVERATGSSPEEAARDARYALFATLVAPGTVLVLAHHADDQVETVLLHLLRGSGPRGLAGMPRQRAFGAGILLRPLLDQQRSVLVDYARAAGLEWVDDPSNQETRYRRNALRHRLLPALQQLLPDMGAAVLRSAALCAEADCLLDVLAEADLQQAQGAQRNQLKLDVLAAWPAERVRNLLRAWVRRLAPELGGRDITYEALQHCVGQLLPARQDAMPVLAWGEAGRRLELRRHDGQLYLVTPLPQPDVATGWDPADPLRLPGVLGTLRCEVEGRAPARGTWPLLEVRFRVGGERIKEAGRPAKTLKQVLQEKGVPPWVRPCVPLVFCDGVLLAVGDLCVLADWPAQLPEKSARFHWERQHLHCGW